jgi:glycosyltransferase involved in cell wall biosynthesis
MEGTSISVLAMNRPHTLMRTINAILTHATEPYEVILVDNGSTDDLSLEYLDGLKDNSKITVIRNEKNFGLSIGTNQGFEASKYDTLIHLDDDCLIIHHGWNQIMRSYLLRDEIGMVIPGTCGLEIRHDDYVELTWALGMCWGITKELFDDIGGYDPQLMHQNECDMALRVRIAGYRLAGIADFKARHNDPGGSRSDISLAREHLGCVQFRDKWASYFRGRDWNYGTMPIYLMQHWPPDQEFMRRWALQNGVELNPPPDGQPQIPTAEQLESQKDWTEPDRELWKKYDHLAWQQYITVAGNNYLIYRELRHNYCHWEHQQHTDGYTIDRNKAIDRWEELTGERYTGYRWKSNILRPY